MYIVWDTKLNVALSRHKTKKKARNVVSIGNGLERGRYEMREEECAPEREDPCADAHHWSKTH